MSDFNIYDDLELLHEKKIEKTTDDTHWNERYELALRTIENLRTEKKELGKRIKNLEKNFESLLETARAEIRRKDIQIAELRREKDDICFRRKVYPAKRHFANDGDSKNPFATENHSHVTNKNSYGNERTTFTSKSDNNSKSSNTMKYKESNNNKKETLNECRSLDDKIFPGSLYDLAKESSHVRKSKTYCVQNDNKNEMFNERSSLETHKQITCSTKEIHQSTKNKKSVVHLKNVVTKEEILKDVKNSKKVKSFEALCVSNPGSAQKNSSEKSQHFFEALFDDIIRENKIDTSDISDYKAIQNTHALMEVDVPKINGQANDFSTETNTVKNNNEDSQMISPLKHTVSNLKKLKNQEVPLLQKNSILVKDKSQQLIKPIYSSQQIHAKKPPTPEKKISITKEQSSNHVKTDKADNGLRGNEPTNSDAKDEKSYTYNGESKKKETRKNAFQSRHSGSNNTNEQILQGNQNSIPSTTPGKKDEWTCDTKIYPNNRNYLRSFEKFEKKPNMIFSEERLYTSNKRILESARESLNCEKKENGFADCSKEKDYPNIVLETNDPVCGCGEEKVLCSDLELVIKRSKQEGFLNPPMSDLNSCQPKVESPQLGTHLEQTTNCLEDQSSKDQNMSVDRLLTNNPNKHIFKTKDETKNICPFIDSNTIPTGSNKHANVYNYLSCHVDTPTHEEKASKNSDEIKLKENPEIKSAYVASNDEAYLKTKKDKKGKLTNETEERTLIDHTDLTTLFDNKTKREKVPENNLTGSQKVLGITEVASVDEVRPTMIANRFKEFVKVTTSKDMNEAFNQKDNLDVNVSLQGPSSDASCLNDYREEHVSSGRRKKLKTPIKCTEELHFASSSISTAQQTARSEDKLGSIIEQETGALRLKKLPIRLSNLTSSNNEPSVEIYSKKMYSKETCEGICSDREDLNQPDMPALRVEEELTQFVSYTKANSLFKESKLSDICAREECTRSFLSTEAKSLFEGNKSIMPLDHKVNTRLKENASITSSQSRENDAYVYPAAADKKTVPFLNFEKGSPKNHDSEKPKSDEFFSFDKSTVKQVTQNNEIEKNFHSCKTAVNDLIQKKSNNMETLPLSSINLSRKDHFQNNFGGMVSSDGGSVERLAIRYEKDIENKITSPNQCESGQDDKINKKLSTFEIIDSVTACPNKKKYKQRILENFNSKFVNHENIKSNTNYSKTKKRVGLGLDCPKIGQNACQAFDVESSKIHSHQLKYDSLQHMDSQNTFANKKLITHKKNILQNYFAAKAKNAAFVGHCESNDSREKLLQVDRRDTNAHNEIPPKLVHFETNKIELDSLLETSSNNSSPLFKTLNSHQNTPSNIQQISFQTCDTADIFQDCTFRCDKKTSINAYKKNNDSFETTQKEPNRARKLRENIVPENNITVQSRGPCENKLNRSFNSIAHEPTVSNNIYITRKIKSGKRIKASPEKKQLSTLSYDKIYKTNLSARDYGEESPFINTEKPYAMDQLKIQLTPEPAVSFIRHATFSNDKYHSEHPAIFCNAHYNANENDEKYQEIDNRMRFIFQSPTATEIENLPIDETINHCNKSECDTLLPRKVSVGSNDYIIESVGALTANVFVTRKKGKKRLRISMETTLN